MTNTYRMHNGERVLVDPTTIDRTPIPQPLEKRLTEAFLDLISQHKDKLQGSTLLEAIQTESIGNRLLKFGLVTEWKALIATFTPSATEDVVLVEQLKQQLLAEFE